jgi:hypothetical protein
MTRLVWLLFSLAVVLAGCGINQPEPAQNVTISLALDPNPPAVGPGHLTVTLVDNLGQPVDNAQVELSGTMAHDGMSPLLAVARPGPAGRYEAPFMWTMAGDWAITVTAALPGGQSAAQEFALTVNQAAPAANHPEKAVVPNNGAQISIALPHGGAEFAPGDDITVQIATKNFKLGENGNHWHLYVNDRAPQMIMGDISQATLRDLPPGQYTLNAYLSVGTHADLAQGAGITITVVDQAARFGGEATP